MDYKEHIKNAVEYIENNLKNDINLDDCAKAAGYSKYHFIRIFMEAIKLSPADYIRKRRLTEIAKNIYEKNGNISEIAFEYGFNSKENFLRAFKKEHHILPSEYKASFNSLKLCEPIIFEVEKFEVQPRLESLLSISLVGYNTDDVLPPNFWNVYNSRKYSLRLSGGSICEDYGVSLRNHEKNRLDYFIGIKAENAHGDLSGTTRMDIPGGLYAVFETPSTTHFNFVNTIHKTWRYINNYRYSQLGCERISGYEFETYIEQSRTYSELIYIPVMRLP